MQLQNCMERQRPKVTNETVETVETVETSGYTCKYKLIVWRDRERLMETKRLQRLWRPVQIHASTKLYGETDGD